MRLLLALGILGGGTWIAYAFVPSECAPATGDSELFCNRLWTPALFAMACGFFGARRVAAALGWSIARQGFTVVAGATALMTFGNFAEYWVFFGWPHTGPDGWLRGTLWISVLLGFAAVLLGCLATGVLLLVSRRSQLRARLLGSLLVTAVSFTVFTGVLSIGILAVATSLFGLVVATGLPPEAEASPA
jgi:hypothetical protein